MRLKLFLCSALIILTFHASVFADSTSDKKLNTTVQSGSILLSKVKSNTVEIGYQIGDIAHQTVTIQTPKGYFLDVASLPQQGKGATYIELHGVKLHAKEEDNTTKHVLELNWQIFRVMQETRAFSLKPLNLQFRTKASNQVLFVHVDAARVIVASLLPTSMDAEHSKPLEDAAPPLRDTRPLLTIFWFSFTGLLLSTLYFAWRFDWLPAKLTDYFFSPKPFKRAHREIAALQKSIDNLGKINQAMRTLRHAFDATAGAALTAEKVYVLFERNAKFTVKRIEIESFYAESDRYFFAGTMPEFSIKQLIQLSHQLMLIESL